MSTEKVMLVEDENGIRMVLRKIIERHDGFEIVGESDSFSDAVVQFGRLKPDVVFMDIGIKGENGIECAKIMTDLAPKTKIIFATAHAEYMPQAFELYAFDYLVKPFDLARVEKTLNRIKASHEPKIPEAEEKVSRPERSLSRILVKGRESMSFVDIDEIILVQRENNATVIYTANDSFVTSAKMGDIEQKLDPEVFMRSHKSYIINLTKIKTIEPYGRWTYLVTFKDIARDALLTQENYEEIRQRFG